MKKDSLMRLLKTAAAEQNRIKLFVIIAAFAVLAILLSRCDKAPEQPAAAVNNSGYSEQYARQLEERLSTLVGAIEGAGETHVMVTLQNGIEYVYASADRSTVDTSESVGSDKQTTDSREDIENNYIIIKDDNGERALVRTELAPTINGVVIVCEGADNELVRQCIEEAVTTALNISSKRVCITKLSHLQEEKK